MSSAIARVASVMLKALSILSDKTVTRSAVDWEYLTPYWKSEKDNISLCDQQNYYLQVFFKNFTNRRKKTNRAIDLCPTFFHTGTTNESFQQSRKQDFFRYMPKSSVSMYETPGSQFFRTNIRTKSGPETFQEWRFVRTFLTILGVKKILGIFILVLQGKIGKEILELSRFCFIRSRRQKPPGHWIEEV